jgi:hypothetical protein
MTGRGLGACAGAKPAGYEAGRGRGYFRSHAQHAVASAEAMLLQEKIDELHVQLTSLKQQLNDLCGKQEE